MKLLKLRSTQRSCSTRIKVSFTLHRILKENPEQHLPEWAKSRLHSLHLHVYTAHHYLSDLYLSTSNLCSNPEDSQDRVYDLASKYLCRLGCFLDQLQGLREFTMSLEVNEDLGDDSHHDVTWEYATFETLQRVGQVALPPTLTVLELRIAGENGFRGNVYRTLSKHHICKTIHTLLTKATHLRSVMLILDFVCPRIFKSRPSETRAQPSRLEKLCLDCNLMNDEGSTECGDRGDSKARDLVPELSSKATIAFAQRRANVFALRLYDAAARFATMFPSLRTFRILWPKHLESCGPIHQDMYARDVFSGDVLVPNTAWGDWDSVEVMWWIPTKI